MNCRDVRPLLVPYVDGEVQGDERALVEAHLSECPSCTAEVAQLRLTRQRVQREIKTWAAEAVPPSTARDRLMAQLAAEKESRSQAVPVTRFKTSFNNRFRGGTRMYRRFALTGLVTALVTAAIVLNVKTTPTVSAQDILSRAQAVQAQSTTPQGILHIKTETYKNYSLMGKGNSEFHGLIESYRDYQNGRQRMALTDFKTGDVGEANGYDGTAIYTARPDEATDGKLPIYRSTRIEGMKEEIASLANEVPQNDQQAFEDMQKDPNVELVGKQQWTAGDGRDVYVLRSKIDVDPKSPAAQAGDLYSVLYFDAQTYRSVESDVTLEKDGKSTNAGYTRELIYEILPSDAKVIWDLSDLKNAVLMDDPNSDHVDLLPESITQAELVKRFKSPYVLKEVPDGFTLKITAPPKHDPNDDFFLIDYVNADNVYFLIQNSDTRDEHDTTQQTTYKTASGLTVHLEDRDTSTSDSVLAALIDLPDGSFIIVDTTLPIDQAKAWIENLVPAT